MLRSVLSSFCRRAVQIVRTEGAVCFALGAADNRLHPQAVVDTSDGDAGQIIAHHDVEGDGPFSQAAARALADEEPVVVDGPSVTLGGVAVRGPVLAVPIFWEREPLESEQATLRRPVGVLALWGKRGAATYDEDDFTLVKSLSGQAAALLLEEQLEEFEDIQAAFTTVSMGLLAVSADGEVVIANAAARRILARDPVQGLPLSQVDHRGQLSGLVEATRQSPERQANGSFIATDGDTYATSATVARDNQVIIAITQSPFSTAAEELTGQVAHELRTPLTIIQGNLQTIEALLEMGLQPEDTELVKEFVSTALTQAARMHRMIAETLSISRIHAGKELELELETFDLIEALDQVILELDDRLSRFEVVKETPVRLEIEADRLKVLSILDNYLKNATKYANPGTRITARLRDLGDMVAIEVEDQGIGIPPDALARIGREAGFRTEISKKQAGGIGLGMVYTRRVTEAHGGRMEVESTLGEGSTFRSILPKHPPK